MNFNDEDIDTIPDPNTVYECSQYSESSGMTFLMKLCMMTNKYSHLNDKINDYLSDNKEEINKQNTEGWTALMLASRNNNTQSTKETVKLLLENNANVNLQNGSGWTALMYASRNYNTESTEETVKILLKKHIKKEYNLVLIIAQIQSMPNYDSLNKHIKKLLIIQHNKAKFI